MAEAQDARRLGLGEELRGLALICLGITEVWAARFDQAAWHLEQGQAAAHRIGLPFLEFRGLAHLAVIEGLESSASAAKRCRQATALARPPGWTHEPAPGPAHQVLGTELAWQGRPEEAG